MRRTGVRNFSLAPAHGILGGDGALDPVTFARALAGIVSGKGSDRADNGERHLIQRVVEMAVADLSSLEERGSSIAYIEGDAVREHLEWLDFDPDVWVPALRKLVEMTRVTRCWRYHDLEPDATFCARCRKMEREVRRVQRARTKNTRTRRREIPCEFSSASLSA